MQQTRSFQQSKTNTSDESYQLVVRQLADDLLDAIIDEDSHLLIRYMLDNRDSLESILTYLISTAVPLVNDDLYKPPTELVKLMLDRLIGHNSNVSRILRKYRRLISGLGVDINIILTKQWNLRIYGSY